MMIKNVKDDGSDVADSNNSESSQLCRNQTIRRYLVNFELDLTDRRLA